MFNISHIVNASKPQTILSCLFDDQDKTMWKGVKKMVYTLDKNFMTVEGFDSKDNFVCTQIIPTRMNIRILCFQREAIRQERPYSRRNGKCQINVGYENSTLFSLTDSGVIGYDASALADQNSYDFTVHLRSLPLVSDSVISTDRQWIHGFADTWSTTQFLTNVSLTFNIPQNQGNSIKVCVQLRISCYLGYERVDCQSWTVNQHSGSLFSILPMWICGNDNSRCITNPNCTTSSRLQC